MKLFFLDDARQRSPYRPGMGCLVAVGGISLGDSGIGIVERSIDSLCRNTYEFPSGEEFKWSPGRQLWMRNNLVGNRRLAFFQEVLQMVLDAGGQAFVVITDCNYPPVTDAATHELDVINMCLERVCNQCGQNPPDGLVITDRALSGQSEDKFLAECLENLQSGSGYLRPDALALNVVSTRSNFVRLLQVADLVTGATLAAVAGETQYSPPVIEALKPLYRSSLGRFGGYRVKIHPDYRYANLYHLIFGDDIFWKFNSGWPLPMLHRPYARDSRIP
jgi:hypothetical protein